MKRGVRRGGIWLVGRRELIRDVTLTRMTVLDWLRDSDPAIRWHHLERRSGRVISAGKNIDNPLLKSGCAAGANKK